MKNDFIIIFITCASKKEAQKLSGSLLKKHLISCANLISGVESKFWWKGKIDSAKEVLVILKTRASKFKEIEKETKRIHSYEVPEIIALPIVAGSAYYLKWLRSSLRGGLATEDGRPTKQS